MSFIFLFIFLFVLSFVFFLPKNGQQELKAKMHVFKFWTGAKGLAVAQNCLNFSGPFTAVFFSVPFYLNFTVLCSLHLLGELQVLSRFVPLHPLPLPLVTR